MAKTKCPDFDLAPMRNFDPKILMTYKKDQQNLAQTDAFIITLGLIFNDLKGLYWWDKQLENCPPENSNKASEYSGQWSGMKLQVQRLLVGLLAEMLNTINENESAIKHPLFSRVITKLKSSSLRNWKDIVAAAKFKDSQIVKDKKLFGLIQEVRSNGVFHYENTNEIHKGYKAYFEETTSDINPEFNTKAYFSPGKTMFESRFYFSDAAIDGYSRLKAKNFHKLFGKTDISFILGNLLSNINISVRFIIEEYIELRKTY